MSARFSRLFLLAAVVAALAPAASAQLAPGDIALVGLYSDAPDGFAFVATVPIPADTEIRFTDNGWQLPENTFRTGENVIRWSSSTALTAGTVVAFSCENNVPCTATTGTATNVTTQGLNGLSSSGDQVLAYQGTEANPFFLYALNNSGAGVFQATATSSNTSALPTGLTLGTTAVALNDLDNTAYTGALSGSRTQLLALIGSVANYTGNDVTKPAFPTAFTVDGVQATVGQTLDDVAGYRLLAPPVQDVTVGTLAALNLVQGVVGQYPAAGDNVLVAYTDAGFAAPDSVATRLRSGRGFFWYLYDQDIAPSPPGFGGGTSDSYALPARGIVASGAEVTTDFARTFPLNSSGFYMAGNPFAQAMTADGVTRTDGGTIQNTLQLYDPATGYQPVARTSATTLATWQGFFVEAAGGTTATFTYLAATRVGTGPPVVGRGGALAGLTLALDGATAAGEVHDRAAVVRLLDGASAGWDADDASKLTPPSEAYALLAPVGTRDGAPYRQAVLSLPAGAAAPVVLAFTATHAGTYTLTADAAGLPAGATVRDLATGTVARLADGYTFTSEATGWTDRFEVAFRGAVASEPTAARAVALSGPRPNPAAGRSALTLTLPSAGHVTATVLDALGRVVATVFDGEAAAGTTEIAVDGSRLAPGVYVVRVQGATFVQSRRLVVAR